MHIPTFSIKTLGALMLASCFFSAEAARMSGFDTEEAKAEQNLVNRGRMALAAEAARTPLNDESSDSELTSTSRSDTDSVTSDSDFEEDDDFSFSTAHSSEPLKFYETVEDAYENVCSTLSFLRAHGVTEDVPAIQDLLFAGDILYFVLLALRP